MGGKSGYQRLINRHNTCRLPGNTHGERNLTVWVMAERPINKPSKRHLSKHPWAAGLPTASLSWEAFPTGHHPEWSRPNQMPHLLSQAEFLLLEEMLTLHRDFLLQGLTESQDQRQNMGERHKHSKWNIDACAVMLTMKGTAAMTVKGSIFLVFLGPDLNHQGQGRWTICSPTGGASS